MSSFKRISVSVHRPRRSRWETPLVKGLTYRASMAVVDFLAVYWFTRRVGIALVFSLLSLSYRTVGRLLHEHVWSHLASN